MARRATTSSRPMRRWCSTSSSKKYRHPSLLRREPHLDADDQQREVIVYLGFAAAFGRALQPRDVELTVNRDLLPGPHFAAAPEDPPPPSRLQRKRLRREIDRFGRVGRGL